MPLRRRADGTPVAGLHPLRRIMPFVMPTRTEAFVLFEQEVDVAAARAFLAALNAGRAAGREVTLFHLVLYALGTVLAEVPRLNRFIAASRLHDRHGIWLSFSGKQRLERDAPVFTAKVPFLPGDSIGSLVDRIAAAVDAGRAGRESTSDREVRAALRMPAPLLRLGTRLVRWLDGRNLLPARFVTADPLYASAFLANLGSIGLDAAYHHLFEYGTIPIFVTMGRTRYVPRAHPDGSVRAIEVLPLRYTYDERIEDGFYAARALERLEAILEAPDRHVR
jgi:hypothetical protein